MGRQGGGDARSAVSFPGGRRGRRGGRTVPGGNGATLNSYFVRPRSRGSVTLRSANPADPPDGRSQQPGRALRSRRARSTGSRLARRSAAAAPSARFVAREHFPGRRAAARGRLRGGGAQPCALVLSSGRHLQDGYRRHGGGRSAVAGAWHRRACACATARSCRGWCRPTPMPRRSPSPRRRPIMIKGNR